MLEKTPPGFCVLPWTLLHLSNSGEMFPCCIASESGQANPAQYPKKSHSQEALAEAWNTPYFRNIRKQMLAGELPSVCSACNRKEKAGSNSTRMTSNLAQKERIGALISQTAQDGSVAPNFLMADFRVDNFCNLRCRMCSPQYSGVLEQEWKDLNLGDAVETLFNGYDDDSFWIEFFDNNPQLEMLRFAGGETLITKRILWVIDYLVKTNRAQKIKLEIHTNLTVLNDKLLQQLTRFRSLSVMISVEGFGQVNSYIRHPSKWENMEKNFRKMDHWARFPFVSACFNLTVQAYNILNLDEFLDFALSFENFLCPTLTFLTSPQELQPQVLPPAMQERAIKKLEDFLAREKKYPSNWKLDNQQTFQAEVRGVIEMLQNNNNPTSLPQFLRRTKAQDEYRKQNIVDFIPELAPIFPETKKAPEFISEANFSR